MCIELETQPIVSSQPDDEGCQQHNSLVEFDDDQNTTQFDDGTLFMDTVQVCLVKSKDYLF